MPFAARLPHFGAPEPFSAVPSPGRAARDWRALPKNPRSARAVIPHRVFRLSGREVNLLQPAFHIGLNLELAHGLRVPRYPDQVRVAGGNRIGQPRMRRIFIALVAVFV